MTSETVNAREGEGGRGKARKMSDREVVISEEEPRGKVPGEPPILIGDLRICIVMRMFGRRSRERAANASLVALGVSNLGDLEL